MVVYFLPLKYMHSLRVVVFLRVFQPSLINLILSHSSKQDGDERGHVLQNVMVLIVSLTLKSNFVQDQP